MANIDLKALTTEQLKVMAYDMISAKEQAEYNLKLINQEIFNRQNPQPAPVQPQVETPQVEEAVIKEETK